MDAVSNKLDYMENQSRRSNLLIDGIPEEKGETSVGLEMKIQQMLAKNLDLDVSNIEIERAHRIGQFQDGRRPRKVIMKLLKFKDRQRILYSTKKLKGTNIGAAEEKRSAT